LIYPDLVLPAAEINNFPGIRKDKTEDLARAKQLLTEAGYPNGIDIGVFMSSATLPNPDVHTFLVADLAKNGIRATSVVQPFAAIGPRRAAGDYSAYNAEGLMIVTHPSSLFTDLYGAGTAIDWAKYTDPKIEEMKTKMLATTDPAVQKTIIQEFQRYIYTTRTHAIVPLSWRRWPDIQMSYVRDYVPGIGGHANQEWDFPWFDR
jgi:peptide/nickel transport system substrate-binding protein